MSRIVVALVLLLGWSSWTLAQQGSPQKEDPSQNQAPPRSDQKPAMDQDLPPGESSSSKENAVDLSPPKDDAKNHPFSTAAVAEAEGEDVQEFHPWDPHRAAKDVEVGDFYFKRKNYRAALERYRDALLYKPDDALASFGLAQAEEKLGKPDDAREHYEAYLKILPDGPLAPEARKGLDRLKKSDNPQPEKK